MPRMRQAASHTPDEHHAGCTRRAHLVRSGLKTAQVQRYHQVRLGPHCLGLGCLQQRPLQGLSCTAASDPKSAFSILLRGLHKLSHMPGGPPCTTDAGGGRGLGGERRGLWGRGKSCRAQSGCKLEASQSQRYSAGHLSACCRIWDFSRRRKQGAMRALRSAARAAPCLRWLSEACLSVPAVMGAS